MRKYKVNFYYYGKGLAYYLESSATLENIKKNAMRRAKQAEDFGIALITIEEVGESKFWIRRFYEDTGKPRSHKWRTSYIEAPIVDGVKLWDKCTRDKIHLVSPAYLIKIYGYNDEVVKVESWEDEAPLDDFFAKLASEGKIATTSPEKGYIDSNGVFVNEFVAFIIASHYTGQIISSRNGRVSEYKTR